MPKTVSASEAKNRLGAVLGWVEEHQDEVIIVNRGAPRVVIMTYGAYEELKQLKEQARRQEILARLRKLREESLARNQDLAPGEGEALADRFVREVIADMVQEGKIQFEP